MADTNPSSSSRHEIRSVWDIAASKTAIACQIAPVGEDPNPDRTIILEIEDGCLSAPSVMGFVKQDNQFLFRWGREFAAELRSSTYSIDTHFVFQNLKMCLYPSQFRRERRQAVQEELNRLAAAANLDILSPEWLMEFHLRHLRLHAQRRMHKAYPHLLPEELAALPHYHTFLFPEASSGQSVATFSDIIKRAGFPNATLVSEAESAAAWCLREYARQQPDLESLAANGDEVVSADGGALTLNVRAFAILDLVSSAVASSPLHPLRKSASTHGILAIFQWFWEDLLRDSGDDLAATCSRLNMSKSQLRFYLCSHFDIFMASFPLEPCFDRILAGGRHNGSNVEIHIDPDKQSARFNRLRESTIRTISESVTHGKTQIILLSGGMFHNKWLVEQVKAHFEPLGIKVPHCGHEAIGPVNLVNIRGALARGGASHQITSVDPRDDLTLGILLDELWNPEDHPDILKSGKGTVYEEGRRKAPDRWNTVLEHGALTRDSYTREIYPTYAVDPTSACPDDACSDESCPDCPRIYQEIVSVKHSMKHREHALVWAKDGKLLTRRYPQVKGKPDTVQVKLWDSVSKSINRQTLRKYPAVRMTKDGPLLHEVTARLIMTVKSLDAVWKWELAGPDHRWADGHLLPPPRTSNVLGFTDEVVSEKAFCRFMQRNPRSATAPATIIPVNSPPTAHGALSSPGQREKQQPSGIDWAGQVLASQTAAADDEDDEGTEPSELATKEKPLLPVAPGRCAPLCSTDMQ